LSRFHVVIACICSAVMGFLLGFLVRAEVRVAIDTDVPNPPVVERSR
jgi:hypothetical protein